MDHAAHGFRQWRAEHFERETVEAMVREHETFAGDIRNELVGCFSAQWGYKAVWGDRYVEDAGYVHRLCVSRSRKGEGIGRELIRHAENYIRTKGKRRIRLDCMADNPNLNAYYVRLGFVLQGRYDAGFRSANPYEREIMGTPR